MTKSFDENGYELITRRVVYVFRLGFIGDQEGRTWSKDGMTEAKFPTMEQAEFYRKHHPDVFVDRWGQWRTKHSYGICGIFVVEEIVE